LARAKPADIARQDVERRLLALAKAHDVLTEEAWDGGSLRRLVEDCLAPYRTPADGKTTITGPEVQLRPRQAVAMALILHELATNAAKYGALSTSAGNLTITWSANSKIELRWQERNGPEPSKPERLGFGSTLITRSASTDLGGSAELMFSPRDWNAS
jgi:two-component sensor histidine kinase